jgi:hypothetical protein
MLPLDELRLGESDTAIDLTTVDDTRCVARAFAAQAKRFLYLFTTDLDGAVYDDEEFVESTAALARSHPRARVLILVQDSTPAVKHGHRLVQLAQRLSSRVEIRQPIVEYRNLRENYLVADGIGYLRRRLPNRYEGKASFYARLAARKLVDQFTEVWEHAHTDPQLRRLHL